MRSVRAEKLFRLAGDLNSKEARIDAFASMSSLTVTIMGLVPVLVRVLLKPSILRLSKLMSRRSSSLKVKARSMPVGRSTPGIYSMLRYEGY